MMDSSTIQPRGAGPGPYPDVTKIPTPPLQRAAIFIMFVLPALSVVIVSLRLYSRITTRTLGLGTRGNSFPWTALSANLTAIPDDWLCGLALVRRAYFRGGLTN